MSGKSFQEKFQKLLDEYSKQGWVLNNYKMCGANFSTFVIVFEKDI